MWISAKAFDGIVGLLERENERLREQNDKLLQRVMSKDGSEYALSQGYLNSIEKEEEEEEDEFIHEPIVGEIMDYET